jgi:hypothetical protein
VNTLGWLYSFAALALVVWLWVKHGCKAALIAAISLLAFFYLLNRT